MPSQTSDSSVKARYSKVRRMLLEGRNAAKVASAVKLSRKRVFDFAKKHQLPTNPTILAGSKPEDNIFIASHFLEWKEMQVAFRTAVPELKKIVARAEARHEKNALAALKEANRNR